MDDSQVSSNAKNQAKQQLHRLDQRPADTTVAGWKNRTLVSAKLDQETFSKLLAYCKKRSYSFNTGLKQILSTYLKAND